MRISKYEGDPLILRQSVADATLEDGRTVEVSMCISSGALIGMIHDVKGKHVSTYRISPHDFITSMLDCEEGKEEFVLIEKEKKDGQKAV